jgi:hypothetical protein
MRSVEGLYQRFLHRSADPQGLDGFTMALGNGAPVEQLDVSVVGSGEYFQLRGGGSNDGFLTAVYHDLFQRIPDTSGQANFGPLLAAGVSRTQVADAIFSSTEFRMGLVRSFYECFLRREPDSGGLSHFANVLQQGTRDQDVIAAIVGSQEYTARL